MKIYSINSKKARKVDLNIIDLSEKAAKVTQDSAFMQLYTIEGEVGFWVSECGSSIFKVGTAKDVNEYLEMFCE